MRQRSVPRYRPDARLRAGMECGQRRRHGAQRSICAQPRDSGRGLNAAPLRLQLEFLDSIGANVLPAQPARAPLVFTLLDTASGDATGAGRQPGRRRAPAAAPLAGQQPRRGANAAPEFFTEQQFTAMRGSSRRSTRSIPQADTYADHGGVAPSDFTVFEPTTTGAAPTLSRARRVVQSGRGPPKSSSPFSFGALAASRPARPAAAASRLGLSQRRRLAAARADRGWHRALHARRHDHAAAKRGPDSKATRRRHRELLDPRGGVGPHAAARIASAAVGRRMHRDWSRSRSSRASSCWSAMSSPSTADWRTVRNIFGNSLRLDALLALPRRHVLDARRRAAAAAAGRRRRRGRAARSST